MNLAENDFQQEHYEEQMINEEYKIWKKNSPFLYDTLYSHCLTWPSLTVQWFPSRDVAQNSDFSLQKLLIGTHTSNDEQNFVQVMKAKLPTDEARQSNAEYEDNGNDANGIGQGSERNRIETELKINHNGEINRARYMPQEPNIIATKTVTGNINIFDYYKHPNIPVDREEKPQLVLKGHDKEGYGIDWNEKSKGLLLSGADDNNILVWDINSKELDGSELEYLHKFEGHESVVEDVKWHKHNENWFGSVSDDRRLRIWDLRSANKDSFSLVEAHTEEILALDFSPFDENLLITSSADKSVKLWDMRNLGETVHTFQGHKDEVGCIQFSPLQSGLFASGSTDRRIIIWDISRIDAPQTEEEKKDGPPELLFMHGGHTSKVSGLDWNKNEKLMLASVAEDNIIQVWEMAREIYYDEEEKKLIEEERKKGEDEQHNMEVDAPAGN
ncbi:unnamed protein product [Moneuplotes crassus]|uniref:Histone-binding protein RBBP4-like N-terminal domain-containing protein n=1 Tax=Euplotes crassus TaxID=5936 RepID=A0AAD1UJ49_EUPCR|nr:unnamed protein product [Moneuplotes crassus]